MSNEREPVPYFMHEEIMARQERNTKRLFILCIIIFVALIVTNAGWIIYEAQFEDMVIEQDVDTGTGEAVVSGLGDVTYGTGETENQNQN